MSHTIRRTAEKIARRLELIAPLVHRCRVALAPWRCLPVDDEAARWYSIPPHTYWGRTNFDFVLENTFTVPASFDRHSPVALFLPLGDAGDFGHPEALVAIDGMSYDSADRHHQEVRLASENRDGRPHTLTLTGWTGRLHGGQARNC